MKRLLFVLLSVFAVMACGEEEGDKTATIQVADPAQLTQNVYADEISGKSNVTFTTTGAWTSSVEEAVTAKSSKTEIPDWISIDPANGDKAGSYTVSIKLSVNSTGLKRGATIKINCNGQIITISIMQEATTEEGKEPEPPVELNPNKGLVKKINGAEVVYDISNPDMIYVVKIGNESYVNKAYSRDEWGYVGSDNWNCYFQYGTNDLVSSTAYCYQNSEKTFDAEYTWSSDKLTGIRGDQLNVDRGGVYLRTALEYGDVEYTVGNIDINWLLANRDYYAPDVSALMVRSIPSSKLLVKKTTEEEDGNTKYNAMFTYRYVFNADGLVCQIYEKAVWVVQGDQGEKLLYEFEYW